MAAKRADEYRVVSEWLTVDQPDGSRNTINRGDVTSDLPEKSVEWLLAQGHIVPAHDEGSTD